MDTGVRLLHQGSLDHAISWFHRAATHGYPGAHKVRNEVANLRDLLRDTATARDDDDPLEQLDRHSRIQASMHAVAHSLVHAARLAIRHIRASPKRD